MSDQPCICLQYGKDGTNSHDEIVAEVINPSYPKLVDRKLFTCYNHLHLYMRNGFIIHMFNEGPKQSKFFFSFPMEESL